MDHVQIATARNRHEAEMVRERLEAGGIVCFLPDAALEDTLPGVASQLTGLRILVRPAEAEAARAILQAPAAGLDSGDDPPRPVGPPEPDPPDTPWAFTLSFLAGGGLLSLVALPYRWAAPFSGLTRRLASVAGGLAVFILGGVMGIAVYLIRSYWVRTRLPGPGAVE